MKHRSPKMVYFSIPTQGIDRARDFWKWVKINTPQSLLYVNNSQFEQEKLTNNYHVADLAFLLESYKGNLQSLHVIVDIQSIPQDQIELLRNIIVQYPEVQFLFDKRPDMDDKKILDILFSQHELQKDIENREDKACIEDQWNNILKDIKTSMISISWEENENEDDYLITSIICGYDNTFDASNLRYAIKYRKYLSLKVDHNRNFKKIQDSRRNHLAICVEEETRQNLFNSYALYANGYRVLPVSMRRELEEINNDDFLKGEGIVIRDYDLQFPDEDEMPVDEIRGYKFCTAKDIEDIKQKNKKLGSLLQEGWNDFSEKYEGRDNKYWKIIKKHESSFPIYFVSKGPKHAKIEHPSNLKGKVIIKDKNKTMLLPGFYKPVCGIYSPFHGLDDVSKVFDSTRYCKTEQEYEIKTSRKNNDHSTPLAIYEMVNLMIRRAENYYEENRYLLAALVSEEAIEFMNGFHHRLMIKAYYIQAKAENAIAMDVVGINEDYLAKDASFRITKIQEDIERFYNGYDLKDSRNVLNQIFSDCRLFCKTHEHFKSESVFLSALGHLNEGYDLSDIIVELKYIHKNIKRELKSFANVFIKWKQQLKTNKND